MTPDLDALRALDAKRVHGEYYVHTDAAWIPDDKCESILCERPDGTRATIVVTETGHYPPDMATAQWLAAISNAGPGLIDEVERLRARITAWRTYALATNARRLSDGCCDDDEAAILAKTQGDAWSAVVAIDPDAGRP